MKLCFPPLLENIPIWVSNKHTARSSEIIFPPVCFRHLIRQGHQCTDYPKRVDYSKYMFHLQGWLSGFNLDNETDADSGGKSQLGLCQAEPFAGGAYGLPEFVWCISGYNHKLSCSGKNAGLVEETQGNYPIGKECWLYMSFYEKYLDRDVFQGIPFFLSGATLLTNGFIGPSLTF